MNILGDCDSEGPPAPDASGSRAAAASIRADGVNPPTPRDARNGPGAGSVRQPAETDALDAALAVR